MGINSFFTSFCPSQAQCQAMKRDKEGRIRTRSALMNANIPTELVNNAYGNLEELLNVCLTKYTTHTQNENHFENNVTKLMLLDEKDTSSLLCS